MSVTQRNSRRKLTIKSSINPINCIQVVITIASYNESISLPVLVEALSPALTPTDAVLIVDDSSDEVFVAIKQSVEDAFKNSKGVLIFSHNSKKTGRGAAIRRAMKLSFEQCSQLKYFIECDADGSHRVDDILRLRNSNCDSDLLIGSRYLKDSEIKGWTMQRKIFSKILNIVIPFILRIPIKDITNGLRRYSASALKEILLREPINSGFTYLSEQAFILQSKKLTICETPIIFANRIAGNSTITPHEILASIKGIIKLIFLKKKFLN